jgi:hypothetical protein
LLTRTSMRPKLSSVRCATSCTCASSVIEPATARALPVLCLMPLTTRSSSCCRRPVMTTDAPSSANRFATASPIPALPPVTIATFPSSGRSLVIPGSSPHWGRHVHRTPRPAGT